MEQILRGGLGKMEEAGCTIVGGHSIRDEELKFGYAVTGVVDPRRVWRNVGARPGDALLLTKPLGTGVIATALKQGKASDAAVAAAAASMAQLNRAAAEALADVGAGLPRPTGPRDEIGGIEPLQGVVHAVTDVTGFGLLGHAREMALGAYVPPASSRQGSESKDGAQAPASQRNSVSLEVDHRAIEYLPGAVEAARAGFLAGGLKNNRDFIEGCVEFAPGVPEEYRALLFDPQTSGGLLVAIAADAADAALAALARRNVAARRIGRVAAKSRSLIYVQ
jgi:selenide,water dikinase